MSRLEQDLAAAISDFWLIAEYPLGFCFLCLTLHLFRFFPFGLKSGLKRGGCPPLLLRGILIVLFWFDFSEALLGAGAPSVWEMPAGLSAQAVLLPVLGSNAANTSLCFPPCLGLSEENQRGSQVGHCHTVPPVFNMLLKCYSWEQAATVSQGC